MATTRDRAVTGSAELEKYVNSLPQTAAKELQGTVIGIHNAHRREVIASSGFSAEGKKNLKHVVRVHPRPASGDRPRYIPKRLEDVQGETYSVWRGTSMLADDDAPAAVLEKSIGDPTVRAKRSRYLLLPLGDFRTNSDRPRRHKVGGRMLPFEIAKFKDTFLLKRGKTTFLLQRLDAGKLGDAERKASTDRAKLVGKTALLGKEKELGERSRVIGMLEPEAKTVRGLDFFGAWNRLEPDREARFGRMMDRVLK